jgi:hypothetical protein
MLPYCAAAIKPYYYNVSGESYTYYPLPMTFTAGEQWCRDNGGHLVSYTSEREQQRVRMRLVLVLIRRWPCQPVGALACVRHKDSRRADALPAGSSGYLACCLTQHWGLHAFGRHQPLAFASCTLPRPPLVYIELHRYGVESGCHTSSIRSACSACPPVQVESYYIGAGFMLPTFHRFYWMGLQSTVSTWPAFTWVSAACRKHSR